MNNSSFDKTSNSNYYEFNPSINPNHQKLINQSNYNTALLTNLVIKKTKINGINFDQADKLVMLAASSILKDCTPYLVGTKKISDRQYKKIENEIEKIKLKIDGRLKAKQDYFVSTAHQLESMLHRIRGRQVDLRFPVEREKLFEDYYQIMGCVTAYGKWKIGDEILGPHAELSNYKVQEVIKNKKGLQIVVLIPSDPSEIAKPILCCRGTTPFKTHNLIDDLNAHIGRESFEASKDNIAKTLADVSQKYGSVVIVGHSLGGAIAQNIMAEFCDQTIPQQSTAPSEFPKEPFIQSLYYFNAPGVGEEVAQNFQNKMKDIPENKRPHIIEHYHKGDIVALAGGAHLKADKTKKVGKLSFLDFFSPIQLARKSHSWSDMISEFKETQEVKTHNSRKTLRSITEKIRNFVSALFKKSLVREVEAKQRKKETAKKIASFLNMSSLSRNQEIFKNLAQETYLQQEKDFLEKVNQKKLEKSQDRELKYQNPQLLF